MDLALKFEDPNELGLNVEKSDFLMFFVNETYPWSEIIIIRDEAAALLR